MSKQFLLTANQHERSIANARKSSEKNNFEEALGELKQLIKSVISIPDANMAFIPCESIDREVQRVAYQWRQLQTISSATQNSSTDVLIVTGALYESGGHTREIEDWIPELAAEGLSARLLLTLPASASHVKAVDALALSVPIDQHNATSFVSALEWIVQTVESINPAKIIISPFPDDIVMFAAIACAKVDATIFWNLTLDHNVSPGLFLSSVDHVIVKRPYLYSLLKSQYKLNKVLYVPFSRSKEATNAENVVADGAVDGGSDLDTDFNDNRNGELVVCACTSSLYKIENDYVYRFEEVVAGLIINCGVKFVHIGAIGERAKQYIAACLKAAGVSAAKFIHIPFAKSLASVFVEHRVNAMLQTFPVGGGLVPIEAMQSGLMIINHRCYSSKLYNQSDFCYPGALLWDAPEDLYQTVHSLTPKDVLDHRSRALEYSSKFNNSGNVVRCLVADTPYGFPVADHEIEAMFDYPLDLFRIFANASLNNYLPERHTRTFGQRLAKKWHKLRGKLRLSSASL